MTGLIESMQRLDEYLSSIISANVNVESWVKGRC